MVNSNGEEGRVSWNPVVFFPIDQDFLKVNLSLLSSNKRVNMGSPTYWEVMKNSLPSDTV